MFTTRRTYLPNPTPDALPAIVDVLALLTDIGLDHLVPDLVDAVDRATALEETPLSSDYAAAAGDLAQRLVDGTVTIPEAVQQVVLLRAWQMARSTTGGDPARVLMANAARIIATQALTDVKAAGPDLVTGLADLTSGIVTEATKLAADIPDHVTTDAAAFRLPEKGRKAWSRLELLAAQLATVQNTTDALRDYCILPGPSTPQEAASVDPTLLHYRRPGLLPHERIADGAHPARLLLLCLEAEPAELTWQEYTDALPAISADLNNRARRRIGLPDIPATMPQRVKQHDVNDLAALPSTA